jgi:hypothetical protein
MCSIVTDPDRSDPANTRTAGRRPSKTQRPRARQLLAPRRTPGDRQKEKDMGTMRILDETGDTMVTWSLDDAATLERAATSFDAELAKGSLAFSIPPGGRDRDAERITRFDPDSEEIIWVRPVAGG